MDPERLEIREARAEDRPAIWSILQPVIQAGETLALPRKMSEAATLAYWFAADHEVHVAVAGGDVVGTYFLCPNQRGGGAHVANCGYVTAPWASGRGVAGAMCAHSLALARERGYRAMQFNLVVSTNERAVRLWERFGFTIVGRLPGAFAHPREGFVDALVMFRALGDLIVALLTERELCDLDLECRPNGGSGRVSTCPSR